MPLWRLPCSVCKCKRLFSCTVNVFLSFLPLKSATEERIFDTLVETLKFYLEVSQCLALGLKRGKTFMFKVSFVEEIYCT